MHHQSIPIEEVGIYKNAIHMGVRANTYVCTDNVCSSLASATKKGSSNITINGKIGGRLVGRRSPTRGRGTDFFISTVES